VQLTAGQTIDQRYVLRGQLGRGGMATVYEAFDPKLNLPVVLKILPRQLAFDPSFVVRFRREGQTLARLTHPHIVRLYELGENEGDGLYYLVLEYLRGGTLKAQQGTLPWPADRVVDVLRPVALALDYAHQQPPPVVHRDLKPANILFGEHDRVVVSDFGLARMIAPDEARPRASDTTTWGSISGGAVLGTPAYMAPEQAEGYPAGEPADRYSLGIVAYELLVGVVPFLADTPQATLIQVVTKPLPLPSHLNPALEPALERVLLKALAKNPALRFASALEMVESLQAAARSPSIAVPDTDSMAARELETDPQPTPLTSPLPVPARRFLTGWFAAMGVLLALTVAVGAVLFSQSWVARQSVEPVPTEIAAPLASVAEQTLPTARPTTGPSTPPPQTAPATLVSPTAAPTIVPTPDAGQVWRTVLAELDTSWGHDWPRSIALLDGFLARVPDNTDAHDKLYSALVSFGQQLVADGSPEEGVRQLERAEALLPARTEAQGALEALTPLPAATPVRQAVAPVQVAPASTRQAIAPARAPQPVLPTPTLSKPTFLPPTSVQLPPTKPPFSPPAGR
jgi:serine/threonine protein kinase